MPPFERYNKFDYGQRKELGSAEYCIDKEYGAYKTCEDTGKKTFKHYNIPVYFFLWSEQQILLR